MRQKLVINLLLFSFNEYSIQITNYTPEIDKINFICLVPLWNIVVLLLLFALRVGDDYKGANKSKTKEKHVE